MGCFKGRWWSDREGGRVVVVVLEGAVAAVVVLVVVTAAAVTVVGVVVVESRTKNKRSAVDLDARFRYYRCISGKEGARERYRQTVDRTREGSRGWLAGWLDDRFFGLKSLCSECVATHSRETGGWVAANNCRQKNGRKFVV